MRTPVAVTVRVAVPESRLDGSGVAVMTVGVIMIVAVP
jgi:hypothetical protein